MNAAPPDLTQLKLKAGDPFSASWWDRATTFLESLLANLDSMVGPGLVKDESGSGFFLRAETSAASFAGSFAVSLSGDEATIGTGTVENITPWIGSKKIDDADDQPKLKLSDGPNDDLRSWACIRVAIDPEAEKLTIDPEDEESLVIIHANDLEEAAKQEEGQASVILPIAMFIWSDKSTTSAVHQIVYFNQRLSIAKDATTGSLRIYFSPAA